VGVYPVPEALEPCHLIELRVTGPGFDLNDVTEAEKRWRDEHGQEAFEQLMEDRELVPHDPSGDPLVLP
jgi:hypothetical protein